jgi:hypothetical protein
MVVNTSNPVKRAYRRYRLEFGASMVAYVAVMFVRNWLLYGPMRHVGEYWQIVIALLPFLPMVFVFAAVVRLLRKTDELYRRICLDSLAIAGGATALLAVTYGLIESDHFPHLSAWWTYITFMVAWLIAQFFVRRQYR